MELIKKYKVYIKYFIAGVTAATTNLVLLFVLTEFFNIWYLISASLAFIVAFSVSFYLQKFWTFRDKSKDKDHKQKAGYFIVAIVNLGINAVGIYALVEWLDIHYLLAQIITGVLIAVYSYAIYRFVIFKKNSADSGRARNETKNNILIATGIYPPDIGGPATFTKILFSELPGHGFRSKVITYSDRNYEDKNIYSVSRKQNIIRRYYNYFRLVWRWSLWADIIYTLDIVSVGLPVAIVKLLRPDIKIVTRLGGDFLWEKALNKGWYDNTLKNYYQERKFNFTEKLIFKINKFVLNNTDFIILNAFLLKNVFVSQLGINKEKIKVIKNVRFNSNDLSDSYNIKQENNIFLIGRLSGPKNIMRLIDAFALLLKKRDEPGLRLDIVGEGPTREKIVNKIKSLSLEKRIKLLPRLSHDEALKKIKAARVVALPSLTEINAYTVNEAQALGKRIVLSQESESFICNDAYNDLWYVDPLSIKDIAAKLMMALDNIPEKACSATKEIRSDEDREITWDKSKVIARHIEVFENSL